MLLLKKLPKAKYVDSLPFLSRASQARHNLHYQRIAVSYYGRINGAALDADKGLFYCNICCLFKCFVQDCLSYTVFISFDFPLPLKGPSMFSLKEGSISHFEDTSNTLNTSARLAWSIHLVMH